MRLYFDLSSHKKKVNEKEVCVPLESAAFIKLINFFPLFSIAVECKKYRKNRILLQHHIAFKSMNCRKLKLFRFEYIFRQFHERLV